MRKTLPILGLLLLAAAGCARSAGPSVNRMAISPPNDAWFQENVVKQELPVVVDFGATWCGPCQQLAPHFKKLGEEHADTLKVVTVDVDERGDLAAHYEVHGIPQLLIFKNGRVIADEVGYMPYEDLKSWATKAIQ